MHDNLKDAQVLVVGDMMLDQYYYGSTNRISPEAPVPVVRVESVQDRAGGAGNVALNISALSGKVGICAMVGKDVAGRTLETFLSEQSVQNHLITTHLPTITKLRVLSQKQQLIRLDFEESFHPIDPVILTQKIKETINKYNVMILSDYGKGTLHWH